MPLAAPAKTLPWLTNLGYSDQHLGRCGLRRNQDLGRYSYNPDHTMATMTNTSTNTVASFDTVGRPGPLLPQA